MTSESTRRLSLLPMLSKNSSSSFPDPSSSSFSPMPRRKLSLLPKFRNGFDSNSSKFTKNGSISGADSANKRQSLIPHPPINCENNPDKRTASPKNEALLPKRIEQAHKKRRFTLQAPFRRGSLNNTRVKYNFDKEPFINQTNGVNWNVEDDFWMDKAVKLRLVPARRKSQVYNSMRHRHSMAAGQSIKTFERNNGPQSTNRSHLPTVSENENIELDDHSELPPLRTKGCSQRRNTEPVGLNRDFDKFSRKRSKVLPDIAPGRSFEMRDVTYFDKEPLEW